MNYILPTFKIISIIFALSAVVTGIQSILDPIGFSQFFGLPITPPKNAPNKSTSKSTTTPSRSPDDNITLSYVSLMGVRQLATGITLLIFAHQNKWTEMATILIILGLLVAGTDGFYLSRSGARGAGIFHAIPGALIALLACGVVLTET
ncbi:hypothetical protein EJ08DRAFT_610426 [Tothia fuscella]|uniref:DUF4267 domain-containing protein n=1 Tax=Tothia fuscella TaxID=1048955 RepID=A0A9P4TZA2_9PEZI|nr:hypothetical protein EJ08DRAFT_610426 [Tothia fuscella]